MILACVGLNSLVVASSTAPWLILRSESFALRVSVKGREPALVLDFSSDDAFFDVGSVGSCRRFLLAASVDISLITCYQFQTVYNCIKAPHR